MGRALAVLATAMSCLMASRASNPPEPQPVVTLDLSRQAHCYQGTIVFLTDHTLAVGTGCSLATFDLSNGTPRQIGLMDAPRYRAILRGRDGGVVLNGVLRGGKIGSVLLDPNLHTSQWIPRVPGVSPGGEKIPEGQGRLLDHAANAAAYLDQGTVRIQGVNGRILGSFHEDSSDIKSIQPFRFLGHDRLLFQGSGRLKILNYKGKVLRTLKRRERGWMGDKIAPSGDGNRLLFDSFTRQVGWARSMTEKALVLPTMGMSADGDVPNGETVRVVDTRSGKECFEWKGKAKLLPAFGSHADIDPSGRLVAILTDDSLAIYRVPDSCTVH
jgi:hypothetical protein